MITIDYKKPLKEEFRITKTDVKKALKAAISSNVYKLTHEFQNTLDYVYSSVKFSKISRLYSEDGLGFLQAIAPVYTICHIDVTFHRDMEGNFYASNYENTTSDDFIYTLMNTLIPIMIQEGSMTRVFDIDSFED